MRVIVICYLFLAGLYATAIPPGKGPDETAHLRYIAYLAEHHRLPVFDRRNPGADYEFHQPPLYYLICLPAYSLSASSPEVAAQTVRFVTILIGLAVLYLTFALGRALLPDQPWVAVAAAAVVAFLPAHLSVVSTVGNDALAEVFVTAALLLCVRYLRASAEHQQGEREQAPSASSMALVGVMIGLGLLTRSIAVVLLPVVWAAAALAAQGRQGQGMETRMSVQARGRLGSVLLALGLGLALFSVPGLTHAFQMQDWAWQGWLWVLVIAAMIAIGLWQLRSSGRPAGGLITVVWVLGWIVWCIVRLFIIFSGAGTGALVLAPVWLVLACAIGWLVATASQRSAWRGWVAAILLVLLGGLSVLTMHPGPSNVYGAGIALLGIVAAVSNMRSVEQIQNEWRRLVRDLAVSSGPVLVIAGWWLWRNQVLYGDILAGGAFLTAFQDRPSPAEFMQRTGLAAPGFVVLAAGWTLASSLGAFGPVFGNRFVFYPYWVYVVFGAKAVIEAVGFIRSLARETWAGWQRQAWLLCTLLAVLLLAGFIRFNLTFFQAQARYLFPALPPAAVALCLGLKTIAPPRGRQLTLVAGVSLLLLLAIAGLYLWIVPQFRLPAPVLASLP